MKFQFKLLSAAMFATALMSAPAVAGPIIIAGTDADDHGSFNGTVNVNGWEFMQLGIARIGGAVTNGSKTFLCIGCNPGEASNAFFSAFDRSGLPGSGWSRATMTSTTDITNFFNGTGVVNTSNVGAIYMPSQQGDVGGGITAGQQGVLSGTGINNFVTNGGGLFTQVQGYAWLAALLPGLIVDTTGFDDNVLNLTAEGQAQFPGLTDTDMSNATPWHAYFRGNLGALQTLVTGNVNLDNDGLNNDIGAVVIGGGFTSGGGGQITCGLPGLPPCIIDETPVPVPATLPLLGIAIAGLLAARRRA